MRVEWCHSIIIIPFLMHQLLPTVDIIIYLNDAIVFVGFYPLIIMYDLMILLMLFLIL